MNASKKREPVRVGPATGPPRKQDRAILTRQLLTRAARRIFARDGFENARVEDIAAAAGKTRGAFYANFEDKEDVFFAIFEEDLSRDREQVTLHLEAASSQGERIDALARHLAKVIQDRPRMLLNMEFKQYAIRHPHKQQRLTDLHAAMCARCMETELDRLLPEFAPASLEEKKTQSAQIGAILEGLALNCMYSGSLTETQVFEQIRANLWLILRLKTGQKGL